MTAHQYAMQEAINDLKSYAESSWGGLNKTFELAISALEKQIPKKPIKIIKSETGIKYDCPNCDKTFMRIDINNVQWGHISNFCEICGQAVDRSDTE